MITNIYALHGVKNLAPLANGWVVIVDDGPSFMGPLQDAEKVAFVKGLCKQGDVVFCWRTPLACARDLLIKKFNTLGVSLDQGVLVALNQGADDSVTWIKAVSRLAQICERQQGNIRIELVRGHADLVRLVPEAFVNP